MPDREHELDGHDHEDEQEREAHRLAERHVVDHRPERGEVQLPVSSLRASPKPWIIGQTKKRPR